MADTAKSGLKHPAPNSPEPDVIDSVQETRVRAAWLYYIEGKNQKETADVLGISRLQVTRLLAEARKRGEVNIQINSNLNSVVECQRALETQFGVKKVIIAPRTDPDTDASKAVASSAGKFISEYVQSNMTIGVGWGRTLYSALPHIRGRELENVRIISLLGGISQAKRFNPAEFAWQFAERFNGEGYLVPAPALVDSPETKHALLEHCGINQIFDFADALDVAFLSAGGISGLTTSYRLGHLSEAERKSLIEAGAVGDLLYNFLDIDGNTVDHEVNERSISVNIDRLKKANDLVLISGGEEKVEIMISCLKRLIPTVFITDEMTAQSILERESE